MKKIVCIAIKHPTEPNLFLHGLRQDNHKWTLAGGHGHPGETASESANRELEEETGLKGIKLEQAHQKEYGDNHVTLFFGAAPENLDLNPEHDPDKEFVAFKYLDPTSHANLHIPRAKNILVDWMGQSLKKSEADDESEQIKENKKKPENQSPHKFKSAKWTHPNGHPRCIRCGDEERVGGICHPTLQKDQSQITLPKVPNIPSRLDQEMIAVPSGKSKKALRQKEIAARGQTAKLSHAKGKLGLPREVGDKWQKDTRTRVAQVGEAQKRSQEGKTAMPGVVSTPALGTVPIHAATTGLYSADYQNKVPGRSIQEHEAAHLLMSKITEKYGEKARRKLVDHILAHFHPDDKNAMSKILGGRSYSSLDPHFKEEVVNHMRDYLTDSHRREYLNRGFTKFGVKPDVTRMKAAWKNATKFARGVTPDWLQSEESTAHQIQEESKKLRQGISHNTPEKLAASEDKIPGGKADKKKPSDFDRDQLREGVRVEMEHTNDPSIAVEIAMDHLTEDKDYYIKLKTIHIEKSRSKITVEPFTVDKEGFNPRKHDFIVRAHSGGKQIGFIAVTHKPDGIMPFNLEVEKQHRRKGWGTALALHAQKISGKRILNSPDMTPDAKNFAATLNQGLKKTEEDSKRIAESSSTLMYPVSIGNKKARTNGIPFHMTIKALGESAKLDHNNIKSIIEQHHFHHPIDEKKLLFMPHKLKGLNGHEHHVLLVYGAPSKVKNVRDALKDFGPHFPHFLPHITIDKEDWDKYSKIGHSLSSSDIGIKFHPAELRSGQTVLKTY